MGERLLEVPDQIVDGLGADREPDRPGPDPGRLQLGIEHDLMHTLDVRYPRPEMPWDQERFAFALLAGEYQPGDAVTVDAGKGDLRFAKPARA